MKKFLLFLFFVNFQLFTQTQIFMEITKNLIRKANVFIIFKSDKNEYTETFLNVFSQDLKFSGYFNVEGMRFTDDIEKTKKGVKDELLIILRKEKNLMIVQIEDNVSNNIIFDKSYSLTENPRDMAHFICDEIIKELTGKPGIARSKILFTSDKSGKKQIYIIDYDGFNMAQLTNFEYLINFPRYFGNKTILFISYEDGWPKISKMNLDTKKVLDFIAYPGLNACISISKKTKELAVVLSFMGDPEIYIFDLDGKFKRRITYNKGIDSSPSFSPDGKYIAFVSDRVGKPQIYLMDKDGYGVKRISYISGYCTSPRFSPDGKYIGYVYSEGKIYGLAIYDVETGKTKTFSGLNCEEISWAPNSRHIVFSKIEKFQSLVVIDIFTGETRTLISGNFNCLSPDWFSFE